MTASTIRIELTSDEALVLADFLSRFNKAKHPGLFEDQAEQRVLWDLEASLEELLEEPFSANYEELLQAARARVRDVEE